MKDVTVSGKTRSAMLWTLLGSFILACGINAGAIIAYHRPWTEMFTQMGYEIVLALAIWFAVLLVWGVIHLIIKLFKRYVH